MIKREDLFMAIGELSEERLEESESSHTGTKKVIWIRYAGIAAAACIILAVGIMVPTVITRKNDMSNTTMDMASGGIDNEYVDEYMEESALAAADGESDSDMDDEDLIGNSDDRNGDSDKQVGYSQFRLLAKDSGKHQDDAVERKLDAGGNVVQSEAAADLSDMSYRIMTEEERRDLTYPMDQDLTAGDLGSYLGTAIWLSENPDYGVWEREPNEPVQEEMECKVYSTAQNPTDMTYVIVDLNGSYRLYHRIQ